MPADKQTSGYVLTVSAWEKGQILMGLGARLHWAKDAQEKADLQRLCEEIGATTPTDTNAR